MVIGIVDDVIDHYIAARQAHVGDMPVPDFTAYRRESTKNPAQKSEDTRAQRQGFNYLVVGAMGATGTYAATSLGEHFLAPVTGCIVYVLNHLFLTNS